MPHCSSLCCCTHRLAVAEPHHILAPQLWGLLVQVWRQVFEQVIVSMLIFQLLMIGLCSLKSAPLQVRVVSSDHGVLPAKDSGGGCTPASAKQMCSVVRQASPLLSILPCPQSLAALLLFCSHHSVPVRCAGWTAGASPVSDSAVPAGSHRHL